MKDFDYKKIIEGCIIDIIRTYHNNPFVYIMETDIQARLFGMLFKELGDEDKKFIKEAVINNEIKRKWSDGKIQSTVLHCELPVLKGKHVDIGIWDESELTAASKDAREPYKSKKIKYAIEIKYNWQSSLTEGLKSKMSGDISKIRDAEIKNGYFLCFLAREITNIAAETENWEEFLINQELWKLFAHGNCTLFIINPQRAYMLYIRMWHELNRQTNKWIKLHRAFSKFPR